MLELLGRQGSGRRSQGVRKLVCRIVAMLRLSGMARGLAELLGRTEQVDVARRTWKNVVW
jgi:hypothetical protein